MAENQNNLKEYYMELQKENETFDIPFNQLSLETLDLLEISEGFRKFLIRGMWTKGLIIVCLVLIPIGVVLGAIYLNNHR